MSGLFGIDVAWGNPSIAALQQVGAKFVVGYLSFDASKNLSRAEVDSYHAHGIATAAVWETTAARAAQGYGAGQSDAREAASQAAGLGMPDDRPIYFAIDFEASGSDVASYFQGVASVIGLHRTGAYGGLGAIRYLFDHSLIAYGWQTYAWSYGQWDSRAQLQQYLNEQYLSDGTNVDYDRSTAADFGQWPLAGPQPIPEEEDVPTELAMQTADGRAHFWCIDSAGKPSHRWINYNTGAWDAWQSVECPVTVTELVGIRHPDGHLEVIARGSDKRHYHAWQTSPNGPWTKFFAWT